MLVVDDSAFARKVLREILSGTPDVLVVGTARDGLEALEKVAELHPDVMTLDLVMPHLDGLGVLDGLPAEGAPRVIVVSVSDADTELGAAALQAGALDVVRKPTALATQQLYELRNELLQKVRLAAEAQIVRAPSISPLPARIDTAPRHDVIVLGTSTGGPQALTLLLASMPANLPVPLLIALHIPAGYTAALAARLDTISALDVREAAPGLELRPGLAVLARGGAHLRLLQTNGRVTLSVEPRMGDALHAPSVDLLFETAAAIYGKRTLGVVLTGMGDDGLKGARAIYQAGGTLLTESERSCVVYGMPRCVEEAGYSAGEAPIELMAAEIIRHL